MSASRYYPGCTVYIYGRETNRRKSYHFARRRYVSAVVREGKDINQLPKKEIFHILSSFLILQSIINMSYPTSWNLARYFYTGLDDPKLAADIATIMPRTEEFAQKYATTF